MLGVAEGAPGTRSLVLVGKPRALMSLSAGRATWSSFHEPVVLPGLLPAFSPCPATPEHRPAISRCCHSHSADLRGFQIWWSRGDLVHCAGSHPAGAPWGKRALLTASKG